ncbi:MAG: hypothetical protein AAFU64_03735, partial [Bacteroidota bacterium]
NQPSDPGLAIRDICFTYDQSTAYFCQGENIIFTANEENAQYRWFKDGQVVDNTRTLDIQNVDSSATGTYQLEVSKGFCTVRSDTFAIQVSPYEATFTGSTVLCLGDTLSLTADAEGGRVAYLWLSGSDTLSTTRILEIDSVSKVDERNDYKLIIRDTLSNCISEESFSVLVVEPSGIIQINADSTFCLVNGEGLFIPGVDELRDVTYVWTLSDTTGYTIFASDYANSPSPGVFETLDNQLPIHFANPTYSSLNLSVYAREGQCNFLSLADSIQLTLYEAPLIDSVEVLANASCVASPDARAQLQVNISQPSTYFLYQLNNGTRDFIRSEVITPPTTSIELTGLGVGTYEVFLRDTLNLCESPSDTFIIQDLGIDNLTLSLLSSNPLCQEQDSLRISFTQRCLPNNETFELIFAPSDTRIPLPNVQITDNPLDLILVSALIPRELAAGQYSVTLRGIRSGAVSNPIMVSIVRNLALLGTAGEIQMTGSAFIGSACSNDTIQLSLDPVEGAEQYTWIIPSDFTVLTPAQSVQNNEYTYGVDGNQISVYLNLTTASSATVQVTATNTCSTTSSSLNVPINDASPFGVYSLEGSTSLCTGDKDWYYIDLIAEDTLKVNYANWTLGSGGTFEDYSPREKGRRRAGKIEFINTSQQILNTTVSLQLGNACIDTVITKTVLVFPYPAARLNPVKDYVSCAGAKDAQYELVLDSAYSGNVGDNLYKIYYQPDSIIQGSIGIGETVLIDGLGLDDYYIEVYNINFPECKTILDNFDIKKGTPEIPEGICTNQLPCSGVGLGRVQFTPSYLGLGNINFPEEFRGYTYRLVDQQDLVLASGFSDGAEITIENILVYADSTYRLFLAAALTDSTLSDPNCFQCYTSYCPQQFNINFQKASFSLD